MGSITADASGLILPCPSCGRHNRLAYGRLDKAARCANCKKPLPSPGEPVDIESTSVFEALVGSAAVPVLIDFWADWCQPCHMIAPEIRKVAAARSGALLVGKVDTERLTDVAARRQVRSLPTVALFSEGREVDRLMGARPAGAILAFIDGHVASG
jgi:thioredoxin 2